MYVFVGAICVFRRSRTAAEQTKKHALNADARLSLPCHKKKTHSPLCSALNNRSAIILVSALAHRLLITAAQS
jgi:hypothetical protein